MQDDTDDITWEVAPQSARLLNYLADIVAMNLVSTLLMALLRRLGAVPPPPEHLTNEFVLVWVLLWGLGVHLLYYGLFEGLLYRTPGKMLTGTRVMTLDGDDPSAGQVLGRTLVRLVPFEAFSFFGGLNAGWHDRWSGTCVVRPAVEQ